MHLDIFKTFLTQLTSFLDTNEGSRPRWPGDLRGMPDVAKIHKHDKASGLLVAAFGELVVFKVARVATFYDVTGERLEPLLPSEEAINFYKNPLLCAAVYYSNKGVPRARVRPSTMDGMDKNGMAVDEDLERGVCGKQVSAHTCTRRQAECVDFLTESSSFLSFEV